MLTSISVISIPGSQDASPSTALDMLQGCHARIRHFVQLSHTLAGATASSPSQIAEAATALHRYFSQSLPLHEADENESLFPRLRELGGAARDAATIMIAEHHGIDELVAALLSTCLILQEEPARLAELSGHLRHLATSLDRVFLAHLEMEEKILFPALESLSPEVHEAILDEMQKRRSVM
jgi:iron-sulfur cluster repair protein YtfE (RIC family)